MGKIKSVEEYISAHIDWAPALKCLRTELQNSGLEETIKWGMPVYVLDGKNVVGMAAFQSYCGLWFYHGVYLRDRSGVLINAQEGSTRGMRQWRFDTLEAIEENASLIDAYVREAITNQRQGRVLKPSRQSAALNLPAEWASAFAGQPELRRAFDALTPGRQREYANYVAEAKQEKTRRRRLESSIPMVLAGQGLAERWRRGS